MEPPDMPRYLDKIDQGLARSTNGAWRLSRARGCPSDGDWSAENKIVRDSIKTLYLTAMFGTCP